MTIQIHRPGYCHNKVQGKKAVAMSIQHLSEVVSHLAQEMEMQGLSPASLAKSTGVPLERVKLIPAAAWQNLTIKEVVFIAEFLNVDLATLLTEPQQIALHQLDPRDKERFSLRCRSALSSP